MKALIRVSVVSALLLLSVPASAEPIARIVLADNAVRVENRIDPGEIKDTFRCGDPIHTIIGVEGLSPGNHSLDTRWITPQNEIMKSDKGQIQIPNESQIAYMSSSIIVQQDYPTNSDEKSQFAGTWTVEVLSDGDLVGNENFNVDC